MATKSVADRVQEIATTTGTGAFTLGGTVAGFRRFQDAFAVNDTPYYVIFDGVDWEVGIGTLTGATTLARTTVLASSNAGALVNFGAGNKLVWCDAPAALIVPTELSPSQITSNQNDYNPTGLLAAQTLRINSDARRTISGLQAAFTGKKLTVMNVGDFPIVFSFQDTNSSANNRFAFGTTLGGGQVMNIQYDGTTGRWRGLSIPEPVGTLKDFAGSTVPSDGLACDGSAVSRTIYAALFNEVGTTWGAGNGSTTFNVPDFRRRVAVGSGGSGSSTLANSVGSTGGEEAHVQAVGELASHTHTGTTGNNSVDHTHTYSGNTGTVSADHSHQVGDGSMFTCYTSTGGGNNIAAGPYAFATITTGGISANHTHGYSGTSSGVSANHTHSFTSASQGSSTAFNVMQPSAVVTKYIKYC